MITLSPSKFPLETLQYRRRFFQSPWQLWNSDTEITFTAVWMISSFPNQRLLRWFFYLQKKKTHKESSRVNKEVEEPHDCFYCPKLRLFKLLCDMARCRDPTPVVLEFGPTCTIYPFWSFSRTPSPKSQVLQIECCVTSLIT